MSAITPVPTPNPDALKFPLPFRLARGVNVRNAAAAADEPFAAAVFAVDGVASVFGVNDFVTVTRVPGADWSPIVAAVVANVSALRPAADDECVDDGGLATARDLLRQALLESSQAPAEPELRVGGVRRRPKTPTGPPAGATDEPGQ